MFLILILLISLATYLLREYCLPSSRLWKMGNALPGPKAYPLIGNTYLFWFSDSFLRIINETMETYGNVMRLWVDSYRLLDSWLGQGLITSDGAVWRSHRKLLTPTFHFQILENSINSLENVMNALIENLSQLPDLTEIDIRGYIERCSLDIIGDIAMGVQLDTQNSNNLSYLNAVKYLCTVGAQRIFTFWLHPHCIFSRTLKGVKFYDALKIIDNIIHKLITVKKHELSNKVKDDDEAVDDAEGKKKPVAFLELLLTNGNLSPKEIIDEVQTFLFAGHDTMTTAITFCIYLLAHNQDIQEKAAAEAQLFFCERNKQLTVANYGELKYIENVIKEAMRIFTPVPIISRECEADVVIPSGHTIPEGALVNFNLIYMHNRNDLFLNANEFNPDRFEDYNCRSRHPYSYVPFSAGARNCIGQRFAMLEMKVLMVHLLKNYKFFPVSVIRMTDTVLVLRPNEKITVKISKRLLSE